MISELAKLNKTQLTKVLPLINNYEAWQAFLFLLDHEEAKVALSLLGKPIAEELIRLSGKFELIQHLRGSRDFIIKKLEDNGRSN